MFDVRLVLAAEKKEGARLDIIEEMLRIDYQCAEKLAGEQFLPFYISLHD